MARVSVGFREAEAIARVSESTIWRLRKDGQAVEARVRLYPHGLQLRLLRDGAFMWSRLCRHQLELDAELATVRVEYCELGWSEPG